MRALRVWLTHLQGDSSEHLGVASETPKQCFSGASSNAFLT